MANTGLEIKEHPVHPMIVAFPIGFWVGALIGDIIYLLTGTFFWYEFSYFSMGLGLLTGAAAAIAGSVDYFAVNRKTRAKRLAMYHGLLNVAVFLIFLINFIFRAGATGGIEIPPSTALVGSALWAGFLLSLFGNLVLVASGWLGGELVYVENVGGRRKALERGRDLPLPEQPQRAQPRSGRADVPPAHPPVETPVEGKENRP